LGDAIISDRVTLLSRTRPAPQSKWRASGAPLGQRWTFEVRKTGGAPVAVPPLTRWPESRGSAGTGSAGPVAAGPLGGQRAL